MSDPTEIALSHADHLVEPPLVDSLHYERESDGFAVTYVPSEGDEPTRNIFVMRDSAEGRQIAAYLYRIQQLIGNRIDRITHAGGADYSLRLSGGEILRLTDEGPNETWAPEVLDRLKQIATVAEAAFILTRTQHA